jgi:hypothetical protein
MLTRTKTAVSAALILSVASGALAGSDRNEDDVGGFVIPCSLVGVNPAYHPRIFADPGVARQYGFVKSRDGSWQVERNCVRGPYHN